jgi:hypothetical protein
MTTVHHRYATLNGIDRDLTVDEAVPGGPR